nr:hypothetical protein [Haloflavibacter putidus]
MNLPDNLNSPVAIFESKSSGFVVLTELKNKKSKPLMAALHVNNQFKVTKVASLYAKNSIESYAKWAYEGRLLFQDKKKVLSIT